VFPGNQIRPKSGTSTMPVMTFLKFILLVFNSYDANIRIEHTYSFDINQKPIVAGAFNRF